MLTFLLVALVLMPLLAVLHQRTPALRLGKFLLAVVGCRLMNYRNRLRRT